MLSEGASERLQLKLDAQIQASRSELARIEEIKRLQADAETLKAQLNGVIEKYNALVVRHVQHKARRKAQVIFKFLIKIIFEKKIWLLLFFFKFLDIRP